MKTCTQCKVTKDLTDFNFSETTKKYRPYCKNCDVTYVIRRQRKFKEKAIEYKGGKCCICGYDKCQAALDFHHRNSNDKQFNLSKISTLSFDKNFDLITKELDKCDLLCSNCHRELHFEKIKINDFEYKTKKNPTYLMCKICDNTFKITTKPSQKYCSEKCSQIAQRKTERPDKSILEKEVLELGYCAVGRKYGVSDNSIRKWLK